MKTDTSERIIAYLEENKETTPDKLREYLGIGGPALFRQLKKLVDKGLIAKSGKPPKVFYFVPAKSKLIINQSQYVNLELAKALNERFLYITPLGSLEEGASGFVLWCQKYNLPIEKTAVEYINTLEKYDSFSRDGLINGLPKFQTTFSKVYLDEVYYLDFYSIERFGKTKLGSLLLYAKQSQSPELIRRLISLVKPRIEELIKNKNISAVGFVPPTVQRLVQLQKVLEKGLQIVLPTVKITKVTGLIPVPQKTLSKLEDRIENARSSIVIESVPESDRILLIDDAIGSGASMNEAARKIKEKNSRATVIGLAITGSFKGFEVVNEV